MNIRDILADIHALEEELLLARTPSDCTARVSSDKVEELMKHWYITGIEI